VLKYLDMDSTFVRVPTILTGLVIAGEAVALVVGVHILGPDNNPWASPKNNLLLGLDILTGLGLVILVATNRNGQPTTAIYGLLLISIVTHGYRGWEYLIGAGNRFCDNVPLFVVNSLKLAGLVVVAISAIWLKVTTRH
jgi:hypothetical protein